VAGVRTGTEKKTTFQKVREAEYYRKIEEKKAEERRNFIGLQNLGKSPEVVSKPPLEEKGRVRDIVGAKIGLSGKVYDKARKVVARMDSETDEAVRFFMGDTLNENIDAASKLAEHPNDFIESVIERTEGDISKVSSAIRELESEEIKKKSLLPPSKYQVLYADMTSFRMNDNLLDLPIGGDNLLDLPIGGIAQDTSVIFLWVSPVDLAKGLKLIQGWGFEYRTCHIWNKEFLKDFNINFDLLLVGAKGNPVMLFKEPEPYRNGNKPSVIRERIRATYLGDKIDLDIDESLKGWEIWR
jgi:hypothetical protein